MRIDILLILLGTGALAAAAISVLWGETKGAEKKSEPRAASGRRPILEHRAPAPTVAQQRPNGAQKSAQKPVSEAAPNPDKAGLNGTMFDSEEHASVLFQDGYESADKVVQDANDVARMMAEAEPERIVAILRKWLSEDEERRR